MPRLTQFAHAVTAVAAFGALLAVGVSGCGGGDGGGDRTGTLRVAITDQAGSPYAEVHVAIREVRVVPAASGEETAALPVIATFDPPRDVEIIALRFQHELLGTAQVPAGQYNQVRLVLAPNEVGQDPVNYLTLLSDPATRIPLRTPSGQQSGLKILGQFEVTEGQSQTIVLDFNPDKAIVQAGNSGNYNLKPTGIRVVEVLDLPPGYGALVGAVAPDTAWPTAIVEAIPVGDSTPAASTDATDGSFRLFVPPGDYNIHMTADDFEDGQAGPFEVKVAEDTDVGVVTLTPVP